MNLIARNPLFDLDRFFDGFYRPAATASNNESVDSNVITPRVDVRELEDSYELVAELPGIGKDNISVTVEDSTLTIEASNEPVAEQEEAGKYLRKERRSGKYLRSFKLGRDIESSEIHASFEAGLLVLRVPKANPAASQRRIEVH